MSKRKNFTKKALSAWLKIEVRRGGKLYRQEYKRGIPEGPVTEVGQADGTGTTITFLPDQEIFGRVNYDFDTLSERIREMAYLNRALELSLSDQRKDKDTTFYFEGGITSFVRHLNKLTL